MSLNSEQKQIIAQFPKNLLVAHRGTIFFAPEQSEAAFRWARNMGAEYIETDMHQTKDGVIVLLHDHDLKRTSNIESIYPDRAKESVYTFTFDELLKVDTGSWFNKRFSGEQILTLEDLIMVVEGYRLLRRGDLPNKFPNSNDIELRLTVRVNEIKIPDDLDNAGIVNYRLSVDPRTRAIYVVDEKDNGHRPGIFPEIKVTSAGLHINERDLVDVLVKTGWYNDDPKKMKKIPRPLITDGKTRVDIGNTDLRCIALGYDIDTLKRYQSWMKRLRPLIYLLRDEKDDVCKLKIKEACEAGVTIISPKVGKTFYSNDGLNETKAKMIRAAGFFLSPYVFGDSVDQLLSYCGGNNPLATCDDNYLDGATTDRLDIALDFYKSSLGVSHLRSNKHLNIPDNIHANKPVVDPHKLLIDLGY